MNNTEILKSDAAVQIKSASLPKLIKTSPQCHYNGEKQSNVNRKKEKVVIDTDDRS
jgi:hypothetical protein